MLKICLFIISIVGCSCPICEDLRILLSPEELAETNVINNLLIFCFLLMI